MLLRIKFIALFVFVFIYKNAFGVSDTLLFNAGNMIVGEIKNMERGVLEIDAPFGNTNFKIEWLSIDEIYTESKFLIATRNNLYHGKLTTIEGKKIKVYDSDTVYVICNLGDIVNLTQIKEGFLNRFSAAIELGINVAQAQDMRQLSTRSFIGYKTEKWSTAASYNNLRSIQNNADPIKRSDGELNFRHLLIRRWYIISTISSLSNTEQKLDIRANTQLGLGNFIYSTNKAYWGTKTGINNNYEEFSNETSSQNSWEGYLGTELNLYDISDINLLLVFMGYSGLSDISRYRADANFDLKYELPIDLFIRLDISFNYDNQPAENASNTDYVLRTGIGWEW
ncbi:MULTISPECIES: DUF481 domain-containing protein [unclassified Carboxylicivirga]|uniref:DUF481 domain-containing protein n=1 Tax=Carboxylicivirga TaxID=1628153 RepID=UPI003D33F4D5